MVDKKRPSPSHTPIDPSPKGERRRFSKIVHDHKGNASVQWYDAPGDYERPVLEIEGARPTGAAPQRVFSTGALTVESRDSYNPYTRSPEGKRAGGQRTDLRKLSAWIKMMRSLEEAKKQQDDDE